MADKEVVTGDGVELVVNRLAQAFEYLAEKAGVAADHFWPILVKQQALEGVVWIIGTAVVVYATYVASKLFKTATKGDGDLEFALLIAVVVGAVCSAIGVLGVMNEAICQIINPEYYALKEILSFAK